MSQLIKISRPSDVPGDQSFIFPEPGGPPATCANNTKAPLLDQCYVYSSLFKDVATMGSDPAPVSGTPSQPNNYLVRYACVFKH